jgi:insertion element IS1 protein InsB
MSAVCPRCQSATYTHNGPIHHGTQHHQGHACGRPFVPCLAQSLIPDDRRALIARLRMARSALRGIGRVMGVGRTWLVGLLVQCFEAWPDPLHVQPSTRLHDVTRQRLEGEADDLSSFVKKTAHQPWSGIAMDAKTRHVMALPLGDRSRKSAQRLGAKLPLASRQHATVYPDQDGVDAGVMPAAPPRAMHQLARNTKHSERCKHTLRQRVSRLVREPLSFSTQLANPVGAIQYCMCHYHLLQAAA